jgi:hypothetical protein
MITAMATRRDMHEYRWTFLAATDDDVDYVQGIRLVQHLAGLRGPADRHRVAIMTTALITTALVLMTSLSATVLLLLLFSINPREGGEPEP